MLSMNKYELFIFDCDGVILDSNQLKIHAMDNALSNIGLDRKIIEKCLAYFRNNFGKSRYHHVSVFSEKFIGMTLNNDITSFNDKLLMNFSQQCKELYSNAEITPGFIDFISCLKGKKFIASGSDQKELREVFDSRNLSHLFDGIYGSPTAKSDNSAYILTIEPMKKAIMFGDAIADLTASIDNSIDFVAFRPYSNIPEELSAQADIHGFSVIDHWEQLK
jgi:phosphoglycolate phosphatase-like HAD superfamily hydrolase